MSRTTARARTGSDRTSLYDDITGKIIAELEAGRVPWVQPWGTAAAKAPLAMPRNAATGRQYSGINGAPYRREKKEVSNERSGSLVMTCTHRTNLGQK